MGEVLKDVLVGAAATPTTATDCRGRWGWHSHRPGIHSDPSAAEKSSPHVPTDDELRQAIADLMVQRVRLYRRLCARGIAARYAANLVRVSPSALYKWGRSMNKGGVTALLSRIQRPQVSYRRLCSRQACLDQIWRILELQPADLAGGRIPLTARAGYNPKSGDIEVKISLAPRLP